MKSPDRLLTAIAIIVFATFCFSAMDSTGKLLTAQLPVLMIVWGRIFSQSVMTSAYLTAVAGPRFFVTRRPLAHMLRGTALLTVTFMMYLSLAHVPLADATAAMFFTPVLVTLFSAVFLKEQIGIHRISAILVGFVGVLFIVRPGAAGASPWLLLPVLGAVVNAGYLLLTRFLSDPSERRAAQFHTSAMPALIMTIVIIFAWQTPTPMMWAQLVLMGALGAIGHFSLLRAFEFAPASVLSPFLYAQIFFSMLSSVIVMGDPLTTTTLVGTLLLVASGVYIWWRERRREFAGPQTPQV